ncbi:UNVERIFIED_CONTAM: hypothetical protein K2H54_075246 [Gekko kuhli]
MATAGARVADAVKALRAAKCDIPVASVATGFPAGQTALKTRLEEIRIAVEDGAKEIDVVINRTLVLTGQWEETLIGRVSKKPERLTVTLLGSSAPIGNGA